MNKAAQILLVDDDASILHLLSIRLKAAGYAVRCVSSGSEALAHFSILMPSLVITDLRMEGMDGLALFDEIHRKHPTLPVIILTAHGTIEQAVSATQRGVFSFLTKPFDSQVLLRKVADALRLSGSSSVGFAMQSEEDAWRSQIITRSSLMEDLLRQVKLVASTDASVFIHGESGTGKELLARAIHRVSGRKGEFVAVNCSAIPENLLESELFGHQKGSFTGAVRDHKGLFEKANGGTLFLDEVGDMPKAFQVKLLRALQEKQIRPVGSTETRLVDVRILSATHQDLEKAMKTGDFREDLYYRLHVVGFALPPLRDRREDIPLLVNHFLEVHQRKVGLEQKSYAPDAMHLLVSFDWPGNVRQLVNVIEQNMALSTTAIIPLRLVQNALKESELLMPSFAEARQTFERDYLTRLLQLTYGNVTEAAKLAQRNRTEFYKLLNRNHLDPALFKRAVEETVVIE